MKKMKRSLSLILALVMALSLAVVPAGAADMTYTIERVNRSFWKTEDGATAGIVIEYDLVTVSSSNSAAADKINAVLANDVEDEYNSWSTHLDEYWQENPSDFYRSSEQQQNGTYPYEYFVDNMSVYWDENIISIAGSVYYSLGGVGNREYRCFTFDRNTGELLSLPTYLGLSGRETKDLARNAILGFYGNYDEFDADSFSQIDPETYSYYVDDSGKVHVVFDSYEIGIGAWGGPDLELNYTPTYTSQPVQDPDPDPTVAGFSDVKEDDWFAASVADIQKYGLINGHPDGTFRPQNKLTLAQAITLAARTHALLNGGDTLKNGDPWYQTYVDYAAKNNLCSKGEFGTDYNGECSRLTMAVLFRRAFPKDTEQTLNTVNSLPDVEDNGYGSSVFYLYRQGVLTGNDDYGTFKPDKSISRAEAAAILNRVLDKEKRETFTLKTKGDTQPAPAPQPKPEPQLTPEEQAEAFEQEVFRLVNEARAENGLPPMKLDPELCKLARMKAEDMTNKDYFDHTSPTYGSPFDMMQQFGVRFRAAGENIGKGYRTPEAAMEGWMNSPGHRANILKTAFGSIGVGFSADGHYWVQMFTN